MMQNSKLRHAFNQCYAFLPLPRWSFLSHMETAIKTWIQSLYVPSNKTKYEITPLSKFGFFHLVFIYFSQINYI
jgi:hypothetical protein